MALRLTRALALCGSSGGRSSLTLQVEKLLCSGKGVKSAMHSPQHGRLVQSRPGYTCLRYLCPAAGAHAAGILDFLQCAVTVSAQSGKDHQHQQLGGQQLLHISTLSSSLASFSRPYTSQVKQGV
jgi:hypothetical protein